MSEIILNVGGKIFKTSRETINKYPDYPLAKIIGPLGKPNVLGEYFIDRNPKYFEPILDYYRTNILVKPKNLIMELYICELDYWNIDNININKFIKWSNVHTEKKLEKLLNNDLYLQTIYKFINHTIENINKSNNSETSYTKCIHELTPNIEYLEEISNRIVKYFNIEFKIIKYKIFENNYIIKNNTKTNIRLYIGDNKKFVYELYITVNFT